MIRILSVDDHPVVREGIAALVRRQTDMELIAEASNGLEAIEQFRMVQSTREVAMIETGHELIAQMRALRESKECIDAPTFE